MIIEIIVFIDFYKCVLLPLLVMIFKVVVNGVASQIPEPNSRRYTTFQLTKYTRE